MMGAEDDLHLHLPGVGRIAHLEGDLASHLIGTYGLLREWGNPDALCAAGLYHAVYGTDGFAEALFPPSERALVVDLIGAEVEAWVYLYAACDRGYTYPRIDPHACRVGYRDRFDGAVGELAPAAASALLELTLANELEIALRSAPFRAQHGASLAELFMRCEAFVSRRAYECSRAVL